MFWLSAISFAGTHIKLRTPPEQLCANGPKTTNNHMNTCLSGTILVLAVHLPAEITLGTQRRCCCIEDAVVFFNDAALTSDCVVYR